MNSSNAKLGVNCACATSNNYACIGCEFKNNVCVLGSFKQTSCKNCSVGKFNNVDAQSRCKNLALAK